MPRYNYGNTPGAGDANATYTGEWFQYVTSLPTGREAANFTHPLIITALETVMNGRLAPRRVTPTISDANGNGPSGSSITIAGSTRASTVYSNSVYKLFLHGGVEGERALIRIPTDGLFFVGRNSSGPGSVVGNGGLVRAGSLAGGFHYIQSPAAPGSPSIRSSTDGRSAFIQFTSPTDTGETPLTGYRLQRSSVASMTRDIRNYDLDRVSVTITDLVPGATYYWRVIARNAVTDAASALGGLWSGVVGAKQSAPVSGFRVSNGIAYVPGKLMVSNGTAYVPAKLKVSNGVAWVDAK